MTNTNKKVIFFDFFKNFITSNECVKRAKQKNARNGISSGFTFPIPDRKGISASDFFFNPYGEIYILLPITGVWIARTYSFYS